MHSLVIIGALTLIKTPTVEKTPIVRRSTTLIVELQRDDRHVEWSPGSVTAQPTHKVVMHAVHPAEQLAAAEAPQLPAYRTPAPMTLIQPDIAPNTLLPITSPIPMVMVWTPSDRVIKKIVPPPPQPQTAANVRPSLSMPNHILRVATIELASSTVASETIPTLAATTMPVSGAGLDPSRVPTSSFSSAAQPVTTAVLSVSDVVLSKGTVTLPPVNQVAASHAGSLIPDQPTSTSAADGHGVISEQHGSDSKGTSSDHSSQSNTGARLGENGGATTGPNSGTGTDSGQGTSLGDEPKFNLITRPKDGHFGVIVVGNSVADEYPEIAEVWADRLAYTVYLHVGEAKSWIMQYCLPRAALASGITTRPDAPWPYVIVTPRLAPEDYDTDAVLVHGFIDTAGHFEQLAVVFPAQFVQSKFVLAALRQWQFRPAQQNGQSTAVEVLLILPEENE